MINMKFTRLKRVAQMPPPPMGGAMPTSPMAMPAAEPPSSAPIRQEIAGPLDTLAKIMYDDNITEIISESGMEKPEDLSLKIWTDYGGTPKGKIDPNKKGTRTPESRNTPQEQVVQENTKSENMKWTRLPQGKTIQDVAPLDAISETMLALVAGTAKNSAGAAGAAAGGSGGSGGASASAVREIVKLAWVLDVKGSCKEADKLERVLKTLSC